MTKTAKRKVITFIPKGLNPPRSLSAQYKTENGRIVSLLKNGEVVDGKPEDPNDVDSLIFGDRPVRFTIDMSDKETVEYKKVDFWRKSHYAEVLSPDGKTNLNPNCKIPVFSVFDPDEYAKDKLKAKKVQLGVLNRLNNATPQTKFNLAFGLGFQIKDKTEEEVLLSLWEYAESKPFEFTEFLGRDSKEMEMYIVLRKAIALKIIESDRGVYLYNSIPVGNGEYESAVQQAQSYFANNEDQYIMLRRKVAYHDDLPINFNEENVGSFDFNASEAPAPLKAQANKTGNGRK